MAFLLVILSFLAGSRRRRPLDLLLLFSAAIVCCRGRMLFAGRRLFAAVDRTTNARTLQPQQQQRSLTTEATDTGQRTKRLESVSRATTTTHRAIKPVKR